MEFIQDRGRVEISVPRVENKSQGGKYNFTPHK